MISDSQRWMLIVFAAAILSYGLWTAFLVFIALMAESGGKNSQPVLALLYLWPFLELVWTWIWLARRAQSLEVISRRSRHIGEVLAGTALVAPAPAFIILMIAPRNLWWIQPAGAAVTILCCWAARAAWALGIKIEIGRGQIERQVS